MGVFEKKYLYWNWLFFHKFSEQPPVLKRVHNQIFFKIEIAAFVASAPLFFLPDDLIIACFLFIQEITPYPIGQLYFTDICMISFITIFDNSEKCGV